MDESIQVIRKGSSEYPLKRIVIFKGLSVRPSIGANVSLILSAWAPLVIMSNNNRLSALSQHHDTEDYDYGSCIVDDFDGPFANYQYVHKRNDGVGR